MVSIFALYNLILGENDQLIVDNDLLRNISDENERDKTDCDCN